jgi:DNA-binding CsgD family transcriptional regulator
MSWGPIYATKEDVLVAIHRYDVWPEELLGEMFWYTYNRVLAPLEKQVLELRVEGYDDVDVEIKLNMNAHNVRMILDRVKRKLRLGAGFRVCDNRLLRKAKGKK